MKFFDVRLVDLAIVFFLWATVMLLINAVKEVRGLRSDWKDAAAETCDCPADAGTDGGAR